MWNENPIVKMCNVRFPLIQAPMANLTPPRLVAAVCNAGGIGSLGAAYMSAEEIKETIRQIRDLTDQPFAVNLFAPSSYRKDQKQIAQAHQFLDHFRKDLNIPSLLPKVLEMPDFASQIESVLLERPPIFSFTFGIPSLPVMQHLKREKIFLMGTATTPKEAQWLEKSGVDAVIAQGFEAGGHRGTFLDIETDPMFGMATLLPLVVKAVKIPVIAAGGIMNGDGVAAAFALGASAVQMGTAFIACPESSAPRVYKDALMHPQGLPTCVTSALTGKQARMLSNKWIKEMHELKAPIAPFPFQNYLTKDIRTAASKMNRSDLMSLYAGQNYPLISNLPAAQIIRLLVEQAALAAQRLSEQLLPPHQQTKSF
jgi:nitronate monooxygenase